MIIGGYPVCSSCPGWPVCTLETVKRRQLRGACTLPADAPHPDDRPVQP